MKRAELRPQNTADGRMLSSRTGRLMCPGDKRLPLTHGNPHLPSGKLLAVDPMMRQVVGATDTDVLGCCVHQTTLARSIQPLAAPPKHANK